MLSRHAWSPTSSSSVRARCEARGSHPANPACHTGVFTSSLASRCGGAARSRTGPSCLSDCSGELHRPAPCEARESNPACLRVRELPSPAGSPRAGSGTRICTWIPGFKDPCPAIGRSPCGSRRAESNRVPRSYEKPGPPWDAAQLPALASPVGIKPTTSGFGNQRSLR